MQYGYSKVTNLGYDEAVAKVTEELQKEGFGVLTEIDVKATMKKKLDKDIKPYIILGACNPPFAYEALQAEEQVGLLMPCNVIVYENNDGKTVVASLEVAPLMGMIDNPAFEDFGPKVQEKLHRAIDAI